MSHRGFQTGVIALQASARRARARGFTLMEVLVVVAIVGVVVALGVPLFNVLTGSRSVEAGQNVVAAALGQARTIAVNEGKYAGVMFYVDPATERTALSVVVISDSTSSLEDADPYDKYKTWIVGQTYQAGLVDPNTRNVTRSDRVIALTSDADATFKGSLYGSGVSNYLNYFGNYRPTVRSFRCIEEHDSANSNGTRPPRNGPYGTYSGSAVRPGQYNTVPTASSSGAPQNESTQGAFANQRWGLNNDVTITRYSTAEQTLLPNGVGLQIIIQPTNRGTIASPERYLRTGVIMFDPQGRLVLRNFELGRDEVLGKYLGLQATARNIAAGVGVVLYDRNAFRDYRKTVAGTLLGTSESDFLYQNVTNNGYAINSSFTTQFGDYEGGNNFDAEAAEEEWLDNNTIPILINRYTGSLSEAN